ncbi:uncharacterized protein V1510DRAFT_408495 [Dipodascopsis tothii]|uniref:uncharacterized protein n=1 Tax=Dipodascopsis tothii TaxID=44089 RepID=UPI0034CD137F
MIKGLRRSLKGERSVSGSVSVSSHVRTQSQQTYSPYHSLPQKSPFTILPPKKVIRALYDYTASDSGELSFSKGDFFHVIGNENDPDWYEACNPSTEARGMVPVNYFEVLGRKERTSLSTNIDEMTSNSRAESKIDSGFSESSAVGDRESSSNFAGRVSPASQPLYGVVLYNFTAERPDELEAQEGDAVIIIAQSNPEWFVAKPIGRLGGPGLIPVTFVEIRDMATGSPIENVQEAVARAGIPRVEEWKKRTAKYKASSIPLGKFDDDPLPPVSTYPSLVSQQSSANLISSSASAHTTISSSTVATIGDPPAFEGMNRTHSTTSTHPISIRTSHTQSNGHYYNDRLSQTTDTYELAAVKASVERYAFDNGRYWYLLVAEMEDGRFRNLCRYYEDFYDFQIRLLDEFPEEAGRRSQTRILPYMPGPVTYVNDSISSQRRANLDEYIRKIVALPPYISRSPSVKALFAIREGDVESSQPTPALPQPHYRDPKNVPQAVYAINASTTAQFD